MMMSSSTPTAADGSSSTATPELRSVAHEHDPARSAEHSEFAEYPVPPPREILDAAGELLRALAAPVRIAIVLQLRESHRCVHELVDALNVPQPLVSQHLKILKGAGVVAGERFGREVLYRLADHHLAHIVVDAVTHAGEDTP
jgi:ArsR family transcriptional regulator, zinc-responsive transcriptional repressor